VIKTIAAGTAKLLPVLPLEAAAAPAPASSWKPKFFTAAQNELVAAISELIIPETDTPGARAVKVNEYIDLVLADETPKIQQNFLEGLNWIEKKSAERHGVAFLKLDATRQSAILRLAESGEDELGRNFFLDIRSRTVFGYYTSKTGIHQELTYQGHHVLDHWEGCPHPGHHGDAD
jgi:hypothetical protein